MIEPVALGQARFHLPGLGVDERGVAVGRRLLCLFPDLQRALGFFRSLSRAGSLKDVLPSLLVEEVRAPSGILEVMVGFDIQGSFAADPCVAAARSHQGSVFTGTWRHFVPYRDATRPLGTDITDASILLPGDVGYALYDVGGSDQRTVQQPLEFRDLLMRMQLQALRPAELREQRPDAVVLRVPKGILSMVCGYLWRRQVEADVSMVRLRQASAFSGQAREVALIRCRDMPKGALSLMEGTPGVEVFIPVLDQVLVQRGFRHPVALESCTSLFPREDVVLFLGGRKTVERMTGPLQPVALGDLVHVDLANESGAAFPAAVAMDTQNVEQLGVHVRLIPDPMARGTAEAVLIPSKRLPELMALVHLMPQALWFGSDIALAEPWTVVLSPQGVRALPIGLALSLVHPRVFLPAGMRFSPSLNDELLTDHFQLGGNDHLVFFPPPEVGAPFALSRSAFTPLSRAAVHPADMAAALEVVDLLPGVGLVGDPVVHHPQGGELRRWKGLPSVEEPPPKALPPGEGG